MKKFVVIILIITTVWFVASYVFAKGETCGFCIVYPGYFAKSEYVCLGKRTQQVSSYMDGGNTIRCVGLALPIKQCYFYTETGKSISIERGVCE